MRRYVRLALLCLLAGLCSLLYAAFSQLSGSGRPPRDWALPRRGEAGAPERRGAGSQQRPRRYVTKAQPVEDMHLAVVACGERLEETVTMLKSAIIFSTKPLHFHIFAEDQLHTGFKDILDNWPFPEKFKYTLYPITFPSENAAEWKKLFKPCASQRLFLPTSFSCDLWMTFGLY